MQIIYALIPGIPRYHCELMFLDATNRDITVLFFNLFIALSFFVLIAVISLRKNNSTGNLILAFILFIPSVTILNNVVLHFIGAYSLAFLYYFHVGIVLLFGPSVLAYLHIQLKNARFFTRKFLFHILPSALIISASLDFLFITGDEQVRLHARILQDEELPINILYYVILAHIVIYLTMARKRIIRYRNVVTASEIDYEKLNFQWISHVVNTLVVLTVLLIASCIALMTFSLSGTFYVNLVVIPLLAFIFYLVLFSRSYTFHAIINKEQFIKLAGIGKTVIRDHTTDNQTIITPKQQEQYRKIRKRLEELFGREKIYLDPDLDLHQTAGIAGCGRTALSQTINTEYSMTFFDLIHFYRVEEVKRLLCDETHRHLKIESIGRMAGFSSRAGFFSIFKKSTGLSPDEFREMNMQR